MNNSWKKKIPRNMINQYDRKRLGTKPWANFLSIEHWYKQTSKKDREKTYDHKNGKLCEHIYIYIFIYISYKCMVVTILLGEFVAD